MIKTEVVVGIMAALTGLVASGLWAWAAAVPFLVRGDISGNPVINQLDRENQMIAAWMKAGRRNQIAAAVTALSVVLSGAATAISALQ